MLADVVNQLDDLYEDTFNKGYEEGHDAGYSVGFEEGGEGGYGAGFDDGYSEGFSVGAHGALEAASTVTAALSEVDSLCECQVDPLWSLATELDERISEIEFQLGIKYVGE